VILADDLGTDKVAVYAEHPSPPPTPTLDDLAARGVLFRNAWSYPSCSPTRSALLTGRYGRRTGIGDVVFPYGGFSLPDREVTFAEILPDTWSTSMVGKWHLTAFSADDALNAPGRQGFDWFAVSMSNVQDSRDPADDSESYYHWEEVENGVASWQSAYATTEQVDDALDRIAAMEPPWLLYVALTATHTPFDLPPDDLYDVPVIESSQPTRHAAMTQAMDAELGRLLAAVDLERTLVIFLGDNGTTEVAVVPPRVPSQAKLTVYEGGINVPLIVAGPGISPGESAALVHAVDVFGTVAEVAGVDLRDLRDAYGEPVPIDGASLLPLARDPASPGRAVVYTEEFRPLGAWTAREGDQRVVRDSRFNLVTDELSGVERLHDLAGRIDDGPDLLASGELSAEAAAAYTSLSASLATFRAELTPPPLP
jgi:arylsulfatase B